MKVLFIVDIKYVQYDISNMNSVDLLKPTMDMDILKQEKTSTRIHKTYIKAPPVIH